MKKKFVAIAGAALLTLSMGITAFAAPAYGYGYGRGGCGYGGYGLMRDQDGYFLDKDAFEEKLDKAIEDDLISADDKAYFIEMYDYCASNGGGYGGGCGGRGMYVR